MKKLRNIYTNAYEYERRTLGFFSPAINICSTHQLPSDLQKMLPSTIRLLRSNIRSNIRPKSNIIPPKSNIRPRCLSIKSGDAHIPITTSLSVSEPNDSDLIPAYRVLNEDGTILTDDPNLDKDFVLEMYATMVRLETMDKVFYDAQRQGRISFYMTSTGEEASTVGSAAALKAQDMIFAQYREAGVLMWRGFTLQNFADQCFSNVGDPCKEADAHPLRIESAQLSDNLVAAGYPDTPSVGSCVRRQGVGKEDECVVAYFGEGAASEGDFHPALNFAATLECPVVFFCRNNGYAISTPLKDQYRGDGIASRAQGYGMASIRVDGNDIFAVYEATQAARNLAISEQRPVLVESMSYRQGHHSTSDDSTRYRDVVEIDEWRSNSHPITRLRSYMESKGWWDDSMEETRREKKGAVCSRQCRWPRKAQASRAGKFV